MSNTLVSLPPAPAQLSEDDWSRQLGCRITGPRRVIIRAVLAFDGYFDADELMEGARKLDRGIARATVYRTLALLTSARLLHVTEFGEGRHRYCVENPESPTMAEIFVEDCGKVLRVPAPFLGWYAAAVTDKAGFDLVGQRLQTFARCRKRRDDPSACGSCQLREAAG